MHINRLFFFVALSLTCYNEGVAQYSYKDVDKRMILVKTDDDIIEAEVYEGFKVKKVFPNRNYYWYDHNMIMSTKGGFTGELLHGDFLVQYRNYQIKEQGQFKFGLKNGIWKRWYSNGLPKEFVVYKDGMLHGSYTEYDTLGNIKEKGSYANGHKHGLIFQYNGKTVNKVKFNNGTEIIKKEKKQKNKPVANAKDAAKTTEKKSVKSHEKISEKNPKKQPASAQKSPMPAESNKKAGPKPNNDKKIIPK